LVDPNSVDLNYRIVRISLAALFICAGVIKLFAPKAFAATISTYHPAPEAFLPLLAVGLPLIRPDPHHQ
jgi:hypothetical protein